MDNLLIFRDLKPHLAMVLVRLGFTLVFFLTEASLNHGMSPYVYVTYRHVLAGIVMLPFAFFLERNVRPRLTFALFCEIFVLTLLGVTLTINLYFASQKITSPTFVAAVSNTVTSITFIIAVVFRFEVVDLRHPRAIAKVVGTLVSLAGAMTMTLYKGQAMRNLFPALIHMPRGSAAAAAAVNGKGSLLAIACCVTTSVWYIMQASTLRRYPAQLSLTTWMCFLGAAQTAVFTAIVERGNPSAWTIGLNIDLWSTIYGGIVGSGLLVYIQLWCTQKKGPVFVTIFNPLGTIFVAISAYFVLGEKLYLGSIIGGVIVIVGLYMLLWGKKVTNVLVEFPLCDASILDDEGAERLPPFFLTTKKDPDALHIAHKCFIKS